MTPENFTPPENTDKNNNTPKKKPQTKNDVSLEITLTQIELDYSIKT
jgi:hypothetical protein